MVGGSFYFLWCMLHHCVQVFFGGGGGGSVSSGFTSCLQRLRRLPWCFLPTLLALVPSSPAFSPAVWQMHVALFVPL